MGSDPGTKREKKKWGQWQISYRFIHGHRWLLFINSLEILGSLMGTLVWQKEGFAAFDALIKAVQIKAVQIIETGKQKIQVTKVFNDGTVSKQS